MSEILDRLRGAASLAQALPACREAAAEIVILRAALQPFADCVREDGTVGENMMPADYLAAASVLSSQQSNTPGE